MLPKVLTYKCVTFRNAICMWGYYKHLLGEGVAAVRGGRLLNVSELPVADTLQLLELRCKTCEEGNTIFRLMVYGYKELWRTIAVNNSKRETICGLCVELQGESSQ